MKKIKLNQMLQLNKEIVSKLQEEKIANIKGGLAPGASCCFFSCHMNYSMCTCNPKEKEQL